MVTIIKKNGTCPLFEGLPLVPAKKNASGPWEGFPSTLTQPTAKWANWPNHLAYWPDHIGKSHIGHYSSNTFLTAHLSIVDKVLNQDRLVVQGEHLTGDIMPEFHKGADLSLSCICSMWIICMGFEQGTQKTGCPAPRMSGLPFPTTPKKKKNPSFRAKLTQFDQKQTRAYLCYNML